MEVLYTKGAMPETYWPENERCSALLERYTNGPLTSKMYTRAISKSPLPMPSKRPITLLPVETFSPPKKIFIAMLAILKRKSINTNMNMNDITSGSGPVHLVCLDMKLLKEVYPLNEKINADTRPKALKNSDKKPFLKPM